MPTGYTSEIYEGKEVSGKKFIMDCARAFGACIMMRDEPNNAEIPEEFKPSTYHKEQIERGKSELKKYQDMTIEEAQNFIDEEYETTIKNNKEQIKNKMDLRNRYLNTLSEVMEWQTPTEDHINLKEFAIKQLKESIDFDCGVSYYNKEVVKYSPEEWLDIKINSCLRDIEYHTKENNAEIKRVTERNKWIKDLRNSLENI
jgi:hypothetical protein